MKTDIQLGSKVRDKISGLKGTASAYRETLFGNDQIIIEPFDMSGKNMPDSFSVDVRQVEARPNVEGPLAPAPVDRTTDIKLGDRVRDRISGYEGILTSIYTWVNGCVQFYVETEKPSRDVSDAERASEQRWELVESGVIKLKGKEKKKKEEKVGGPSVRHQRPAF